MVVGFHHHGSLPVCKESEPVSIKGLTAGTRLVGEVRTC